MSNKTVEKYLYVNAEDYLEKYVNQEEGFYETLQHGQNETTTKRNDNHPTTGDTTPFFLGCRKHAQSFLIFVLYAVVLLMICVYVYSEGKRKGVITPTALDTNKSIDELEKRLVNVERENSKLKRQQEEQPNVSFTASLGTDLKELETRAVIVFDEVISNFGNGYDNATGYFMAPKNGIYAFFVNIMSEYGSGLTYIETKIMKGDRPIAKMYSGSYNSYDSSSNMVIIALKKGEYVSVRMNELWSNNYSIHCCFSTFSGFLVARDGYAERFSG